MSLERAIKGEKGICPSGKRKYYDKASAESSAKSRREIWDCKMYVYQCQLCDYFHLTKIRQEKL